VSALPSDRDYIRGAFSLLMQIAVALIDFIERAIRVTGPDRRRREWRRVTRGVLENRSKREKLTTAGKQPLM